MKESRNSSFEFGELIMEILIPLNERKPTLLSLPPTPITHLQALRAKTKGCSKWIGFYFFVFTNVNYVCLFVVTDNSFAKRVHFDFFLMSSTCVSWLLRYWLAFCYLKFGSLYPYINKPQWRVNVSIKGNSNGTQMLNILIEYVCTSKFEHLFKIKIPYPKLNFIIK